MIEHFKSWHKKEKIISFTFGVETFNLLTLEHFRMFDYIKLVNYWWKNIYRALFHAGHPYSYGINSSTMRPAIIPTAGLRYKNLGKSGLRVSNVALGTWPIFTPSVSSEQAETIIKQAFDSGINLFDLSEAHSGVRAEIEMGKIIQKYGWKRATFIIVTKIYWSTKSEERGLSRKHIIESIKASLQRLQVDYIDIILIHRADNMCPMEGNLMFVETIER